MGKMTALIRSLLLVTVFASVLAGSIAGCASGVEMHTIKEQDAKTPAPPRVTAYDQGETPFVFMRWPKGSSWDNRGCHFVVRGATNGQSVQESGDFRCQAGYVEVRRIAATLAPGDYVVELAAESGAKSEHAFSVLASPGATSSTTATTQAPRPATASPGTDSEPPANAFKNSKGDYISIPLWLSMYPGVSVSDLKPDPAGGTDAFVFSTKDQPQRVISFYVESLQKAGLKTTVSGLNPGGLFAMVGVDAVDSASGRAASIMAFGFQEETQVKIGLSVTKP